MTKMQHLKDTVIHKKIILEIGEKVVDWLVQNGRNEEAIDLAKRLIIHDNSKISEEEMGNFLSIESHENMVNPNVLMDENIKAAVAAHWKNNRHHPEHFSDYHNMNEVDIIEMVCDWYSRSLQNKTDFLNFVETRQKNRFKFDEDFYNKVKEYCLTIIEINK